MKAQELRIGNLVNYEQTTHIVSGVDMFDVYSYWNRDKEKEILYKTPITHIEPIPLTKEWLLKFGFEGRKDTYFKFGDYPHTISLNKNGYNYRVEIVCQSIAWIKHIHQLQNLYFSLTGCELEINLNK